MKIKIQNRASYESRLKKLGNEIDNKVVKKPFTKNGIYFESLTAVRKILTDYRLDVWRAIRDKNPESITLLAEILGRGFRPVHRDVMLLKDLGLIKLIEGPGKRGNVQKVVSLFDELSLAVGGKGVK